MLDSVLRTQYERFMNEHCQSVINRVYDIERLHNIFYNFHMYVAPDAREQKMHIHTPIYSIEGPILDTVVTIRAF